MPLNRNTTKEEHETISKILDRAEGLFGMSIPRMDLHMDIAAAHCNGCPLKLGELLAAPDFDFAHDVGGIHRHINRQTGELEDCFLPRFAKPEVPADAAGSGILASPLGKGSPVLESHGRRVMPDPGADGPDPEDA